MSCREYESGLKGPGSCLDNLFASVFMSKVFYCYSTLPPPEYEWLLVIFFNERVKLVWYWGWRVWWRGKLALAKNFAQDEKSSGMFIFLPKIIAEWKGKRLKGWRGVKFLLGRTSLPGVTTIHFSRCNILRKPVFTPPFFFERHRGWHQVKKLFRLSKRQPLTTVLFRTTRNRTIT